MSTESPVDDGSFVGEDADHATTSLKLAVDPLERVSRPDLAPVGPGKLTKGEHLLFRSVHESGDPSESAGKGGRHVVPLGGDLLLGGVGEDGAEGRRHHLVLAIGHAGQQVAGEVDLMKNSS